MATKPSQDGNSSPTKAKTGQLAPPEEQFWKRYSPHHEFPLSLSSSVVLHLMGLAILIFGAILLLRFIPNTAVAVDAVTIAGGGGNPDGIGNDRGDGAVLPGKEVVESDKPPEKMAKNVPSEKLQTPDATTPPLVTEPSKDDRMVDQNAEAMSNQAASVRSKAKEKLAAYLAGKGQGGSGMGGGKGKGRGTGEGDLEGPGKSTQTQRDRRRARWTMVFNTRGGQGQDYLKQLDALGAILAVPTSGDNYLVIRDLKEKPVRSVVEDIRQFNMIWWVDDMPQSVHSLAAALGIPVPEHFVAFFPLALEQELLQKEQQAYRGNEDDIVETRFRVEWRSGHYEPVVSEVRRKR